MGPPPRSARPRGVGYALGAAVLFGLSAPCAKLLLARTSPVLLAALLYLGAGLGVAAVRAVPGAPARGAPLGRRDAPWLAGAVLFGGVLGPLLLLLGLRGTPAAAASLLLNLEGVFTAAIAWRLFHEHVDRRLVLGMALIVLAGGLLSYQGRAHVGPAWGPLAVAGACLCWALDNNLTRRVADADALQLVAIKGAVAGSVNLALALAVGARWPAPWAIAAALGLGFASYGLSLVLFVLALRHLGTARTGAYFALAPFVGAGAALVWLREPVGPLFYPAAALMGAGIALHLTERHAHAHRHEAMTHAHAHAHDEHHAHEHPPGVDAADGHTHEHTHAPLEHAHPHYPDAHHRHAHED